MPPSLHDAIPSENHLLEDVKTLRTYFGSTPYGSVPNLYQMLLPPEQRVKQFHVGNVEFDPVQVGFSTEPAADGASFLFDTAVPGNWNVGHDYSTRSLTDAQRWELIEYLKTL
jgi:hypothetical protein